jgi:selenium metabolism protein YedF
MMTEMEVVDARGLACPQPVILAKQAVEKHRSVEVIVDDTVARENIRRMAKKLGCTIQVEEREKGTFHILLALSGAEAAEKREGVAAESFCGPVRVPGPLVVVFSENRMGRGNHELGEVLVKAFIHTLSEQEEVPDTIIFYNTGVYLTVKDGESVADLKKLAEAGANILVCGTCTNYFNISKDVAVGVISNMYDIAETMCQAGRLVMP